MSFILKIVEGPMRGAEVALTEGLRVSVGSGDDCDVVIADGSLPPRAFELDVAADAVTLVKGEEPQVLEAFAPFSVGTTTFAVGPADAPWPEGLAERAREGRASGASEASGSSGASSSSSSSDSRASSGSRTSITTRNSSEAGSPAGSADGRERAGESGEAANEASERRGGLRGCLVSAAIFFIILALLATALYYFWPKISSSCPAAEKGRVVLVEKSRTAWNWAAELCASLKAKCVKAPPVVVPGPSLAEIAAQYGLALSEKDGAPLLAGNLRRRTERLAIRSLALADDPSVRFDLTDDETLRASADELLFVVTEGSLKAVAASNRVVAVEGRVATVAALEKAVRALSADVKGLERLDTAKVTVGGPVPTAQGETATPAAKKRAAKASSPDYPIAGILTAPYPCVVLRNGLRLTEGASIGSALLVKIEADKLTLKDGGATIEWKP